MSREQAVVTSAGTAAEALCSSLVASAQVGAIRPDDSCCKGATGGSSSFSLFGNECSSSSSSSSWPVSVKSGSPASCCVSRAGVCIYIHSTLQVGDSRKENTFERCARMKG